MQSTLQSRQDRRRNLSSWLLSLPTLIWLTCFFLIPYLIVVIYSFLSPDIYDVKFEVSLDAYRQIFSGDYLRPFLLSFRLA
ncbi:MAG TPA: spermidine/putrescine ABC transporter permease, partial [Candidatus Cloacimonas sp.]|nr:spermidine/putrescine ABC transporter permease [Candidatus Cloacimonas sp.]